MANNDRLRWKYVTTSQSHILVFHESYVGSHEMCMNYLESQIDFKSMMLIVKLK